MAYPDDERNGTTAVTPPTQTDPGSIVNYAPPVGAAPSREAQIKALLPALPDNLKQLGFPDGNSNPSNILVVPNSAADQRDADFARFGTGLPDEVHQSFQSHRQALEEADKYLTVAGHIHSMRNDIESKLDSADFLKDFSKIDHTSPTYEQDSAKLFAKYPKAGGPAVQDAVASLHGARANYLQATAPGGADEFGTNTPERAAYVTRFHETKNPQAARAHALNTQKGEEMIKTAVASGLIDPDTDFPKWDGEDKTRPSIYNPDGSVNYHEAGLLAANRASELTGKGATAEAKAAQRAVEILKSFDSDPVLGRTPEAKELKPILLQRVLQYEKSRSGTTATGAANTSQSPTKKYSAGF